MSEKKKIQRRTVMKLIVGGISAAVGAIMGIPLFVSIFSPVIKNPQDKKSRWSELGKVSDYPIGKITHAITATKTNVSKGVYVWHKKDNDFVIYSRSCTDLGCPIKWDEGSEVFVCPCHGGMFSKEGERMAGPPKKPLYRYQFKITNDVLEIDLSSVPVVA